jgi:hypothetical protein
MTPRRLLPTEAATPHRGKGDEMIGMILNPPVDSISAVSGDRSGSPDGLEAPSPGPEESCYSCGARMEHDVPLCPWCGRAALEDAVFDAVARR